MGIPSFLHVVALIKDLVCSPRIQQIVGHVAPPLWSVKTKA